MDLPPTPPLTSSGMSSSANTTLSIDRLNAKASYNEAYKKANQQKNELSVKRLRMYEEDLDIECVKVKARQDEIKTR